MRQQIKSPVSISITYLKVGNYGRVSGFGSLLATHHFKDDTPSKILESILKDDSSYSSTRESLRVSRLVKIYNKRGPSNIISSRDEIRFDTPTVCGK